MQPSRPTLHAGCGRCRGWAPNTHSRRRSTVSGRVMRPWSEGLKGPRIASATPQLKSARLCWFMVPDMMARLRYYPGQSQSGRFLVVKLSNGTRVGTMPT
jgi:hypothetical protein